MEALNHYCGFLLTAAPLWQSILGSIFLLLFLGFFTAPLVVWALVGGGLLVGFGASWRQAQLNSVPFRERTGETTAIAGRDNRFS